MAGISGVHAVGTVILTRQRQAWSKSQRVSIPNLRKSDEHQETRLQGWVLRYGPIYFYCWTGQRSVPWHSVVTQSLAHDAHTSLFVRPLNGILHGRAGSTGHCAQAYTCLCLGFGKVWPQLFVADNPKWAWREIWPISENKEGSSRFSNPPKSVSEEVSMRSSELISFSFDSSGTVSGH